MDNNLTFSKIVATPTLNSWSQAYNAGKLFAVISLEKNKDLPEMESLNMLGKDLLERLEKEFFVIEDKNLESIKKAVLAIFDQKIEGVDISFAAGALVNNILYLFGLGNAKVFIKRDGNLGLLLDAGSSDQKNIVSSSGFLKEEDLIVLTTDAFSQVITQDDLSSGLNDTDPAEIAESLAPKVHKAENGKISAIIIKYKNVMTEEVIDEGTEISTPTEVTPEENLSLTSEGGELQTEKKEKPSYFFNKYLSLGGSGLKKINLKKVLSRKFVLALIIIIVVGALVFTVSLAIQEQKNAKIRAVFAQVYPQAQKKYDEGQSLVDLNKNFARDSFLAAQKMLNDNISQFPLKSKEYVQTQDLLKKVDAGVALFSPVDKSGLDRSKLTVTVENGSGVEGAAGKAADILKELGYNVASTGNADNYSYQGVTIKVKSSQNNFINLLKQDLLKDYVISTSSSDLPSDSSTDALVIIGK